MDAAKTKAGGFASRPASSATSRSNPTLVHRTVQPRPSAAATYAGTVLREARGIVEQVHKRGPGPGIKLASRRLRAALDALDWVCEYAANEVRP